MTAIIVFLVVVFAAAGAAGLRFYRSGAWNYVDIMYYPLAAVGVALLFANNSTQRQLFEFSRLADKHKADLQAIVSSRPDVRVLTSDELVDSSLGLIATISDLGAVCSKIPAVDPQCMVAQRLRVSVDNFLKIARANYASPELRLAGACSAAERLLDDIRAKEEISSLVGDELIAQYKAAVSKNYNPLAYDSVASEAQAFEQRALGRVEWLRNIVPDKDSESMRLMFAMHRSEIDFGKTILQGLYPCIVAPKKDLDLLAKWTTSRQSEEAEINRIERDRQHAKDSGPGDPVLLWIHLNLWPLVLISALSLKFAKGVAAFRKASSSEIKGLTPDPERGIREQEAPSLQADSEVSSPALVAQQSPEPPDPDDVASKS